MEYTRKIDWQINNDVKVELVKRFIDVQALRISTTKGVVDIEGELKFVGKDVEMKDIPFYMRNVDRALRGITYLRDIRWKLIGWKKEGDVFKPVAVYREDIEKRKKSPPELENN